MDYSSLEMLVRQRQHELLAEAANDRLLERHVVGTQWRSQSLRQPDRSKEHFTRHVHHLALLATCVIASLAAMANPFASSAHAALTMNHNESFLTSRNQRSIP